MIPAARRALALTLARGQPRTLTLGGRPQIRHHGHEQPQYPGHNVPFDVTKHRKLAVIFTLFFGTAFAIPFVNLRSHLKRASGQ